MANRQANMQGVKTHSTKKANTHSKQNKGATIKTTPKKTKKPKQTNKPGKQTITRTNALIKEDSSHKIDRLVKTKANYKLQKDFTQEQYKSFARRINGRLKTIQNKYGVDSKLYSQYIKELDKLDNSLLSIKDDGSYTLKYNKNAYNTLVNAPVNKFGNNIYTQSLNLVNSYDTVAIQNERVKRALEELGVDWKYDSADKGLTIDMYLSIQSEMLNEIGEYISEHYEEVLYKDAESERSEEDKEMIEILRQETNTYTELEKVYKYIKKEQKRMKNDAKHQERNEKLARLNKKKVK